MGEQLRCDTGTGRGSRHGAWEDAAGTVHVWLSSRCRRTHTRPPSCGETVHRRDGRLDRDTPISLVGQPMSGETPAVH